MKQKYHFFKATQMPGGKSLLSLPGQKLGGYDITPGILVKDMRGSTAVSSARRKAVPGEVFFTTTLRRNGLSLRYTRQFLKEKAMPLRTEAPTETSCWLSTRSSTRSCKGRETTFSIPASFP